MKKLKRGDGPLERIAFASDLHLNFLEPDQRAEFYDAVRGLGFDGLVLAGDTSVGSRLVEDLKELSEALQRPVWFTLGNHCWWMTKTDALRERLRVAVEESAWLYWLDANGPHELANGVSLLGVDNWADDPWDHVSRKPKDWIHIQDFVGYSTEERLAMSKRFAEQAAERLHASLVAAARSSKVLITVCHIPPRFPSAFIPENGDTVSIAPWLGSFACGEAIASVAEEFPDTRIIILSGHLHERIRWQPRENVELRIAKAEYYAPSIEDVFDLVHQVWLFKRCQAR